MLAVRYKCSCMKEAATVWVRHRRDGEDVCAFVSMTIGNAIFQDHRLRSRFCAEAKTEYVKFQIPSDGRGVGMPPQKPRGNDENSA